jgi:SagB-type dehydrogenase family enzyme
LTNWSRNSAREYHRVTKYALDWPPQPHTVESAIIPRTYKLYRDLEALPLPPPKPSTLPALTAIGGRVDRSRPLVLAMLSSLLHFSAGIIRRPHIGGRTLDFRAASCTGALYHVELYVVAGDLPDLAAGVYHYGVQDESLRCLRAGDYRSAVLEAVCDAAPFRQAEAVVVATSTFWRNAWRYEDRAYRHVFWDCGTILANLLSLAAAHGVQASLAAGFIDGALNRLIGIDGRREAAVALVALGHSAVAAPARAVEALDLPVVPLSPIEIEYPYITGLHDDSGLATCEEVERWRSARIAALPTPGTDVETELALVRDTEEGERLEEVIGQRGSARHFRSQPLKAGALAQVLDRAFQPVECDFRHAMRSLTDAFLIVSAVEGVPAGAYMYHAGRRAVELIREGDFRAQAQQLALNQAPAGGAAVSIYFLARLGPIVEALGARGYRAAQLDGGLRGGRVYLSAYALGLKATGLTFFDDAVIEFFGERAAGYDVMFLALVGP